MEASVEALTALVPHTIKDREMPVKQNGLTDRIDGIERRLSDFDLQLDSMKRAFPEMTDRSTVQLSPEISPSITLKIPGCLPLKQFKGQITDLTLEERVTVVTAAISMLQGVFAHLPLKKAMHGIDPVQRLRLLERRVEGQLDGSRPVETAAAFHSEMIEIFHSLRDLHTNYILPGDYQGMTAFLPFLIQEYFAQSPKVRRYVVTRVHPLLDHPTFRRGVNVTNWNGIPIERAVEIAASREAGSNDDARHARGLDSLTLRSMALDAPPDEEWVIIGYEANGRAMEIKFDWSVMRISQSPTGIDADACGVLIAAGEAGRLMGFDGASISVRRAKKHLFFPDQIKTEEQMAKVLVTEDDADADFFKASIGNIPPTDGSSTGHRTTKSFAAFETVTSATQHFERAASATAGGADSTNSQMNSLLPEFFSFRTLTVGPRTFGYIRIYSFMAWDPNAFVAEFIRLAQLLPKNGLVIDVRGNGGGNINAGEMLLQVLTPNRIEPERFHFINTDQTLKLCKNNPSLSSWVESIDLSLETGEIYSQGFPLTSPKTANSGLWRYPGKVLLLTDALCYSTTDIFTAGFQDHNIGQILGTSSRTGAGGANVWSNDFFIGLDGFPPLPKQTAFRTAIRRATRVGSRSGVPLEDLGVATKDVHDLTLRDVMEGNVDLMVRAAEMLF